MQLLVPHLQRAQRIRATLSQLDQRARNFSLALDALSAGVVLLSRQGTVLHLNTTAEAIVRAQDGLSVRHGRLSAPRAVETQALARLVDRVCGRQGAPVGGALQLARTSGKRPLQLVATPLSMSVSALGSHRVDVDLNAVALCFISGHEHQTQDAHAVLPQIFGLTPSETRLAVSLLDGGSLTEFAARHGVSVNTAKTQLASLFAKTGAHRQGEVVTILRAACGHLRVAAGGEARISRP
jgi:DNA-binding CsgD family transcriptional regulator